MFISVLFSAFQFTVSLDSLCVAVFVHCISAFVNLARFERNGLATHPAESSGACSRRDCCRRLQGDLRRETNRNRTGYRCRRGLPEGCVLNTVTLPPQVQEVQGWDAPRCATASASRWSRNTQSYHDTFAVAHLRTLRRS
jgi:hypothetical protein